MADYVPQDPRPSKAAVLGHPIHPMLIPFPIALLFLVPVTDLVFASTGDFFWARVSYYALWAGLGTGALAAIAGLIDFVAIPRARSHRQGWAHLGSMVGVMALALVNVLLRIGDLAGPIVPNGVILSVVGAALLIVGGWYGGELAYRHKIGMIGPDDESSRDLERTQGLGAAPPRDRRYTAKR